MVWTIPLQAVFGQELSPEGYFLGDSLKVGEEINYSLFLKYPKDIDVVFPDSTYSFSPFEYVSKVSAPTQSDSIFSIDSAIYTLATFEIDSVQTLQLPIFIVTGGDSVAIWPAMDSIYLKHVVTSIPDSIAMIENTNYSNVKLGFNYPYLIVGVTIISITGIILLLVFGKTIRKKIILYRLKRMHQRFLFKFIPAIRDLGKENNFAYLEKLLGDWKGYMERLNRVPYTKMTSKEIQEINQDKQLVSSLHTIDKAVYGGMRISELPESFDYLRRISEDSYYSRIQKIKNG